MEDRATCRIASQYLANWLHHGLISREEILDAFNTMAVKVDKQNANDNNYTELSGGSDNLAFSAALELVFEGKNQSCGYVEDILIKYRRKFLERNQ